MLWHFPHYTNQGGRPGSAVREGRWKLIEFHDTRTTELYDLTADPGESRDLAGTQPRLERRLHQRLDDWRRSINAQTNAPNPACDDALFRALYLDFDPSRFHPVTASPPEWERIAAWRRQMDAVVTAGR
jgi:hypothetical protein